MTKTDATPRAELKSMAETIRSDGSTAVPFQPLLRGFFDLLTGH
jgi:hypothetical protein